jgi:hypothetical protein
MSALDAAELALIQQDLQAMACDKACIIQRGSMTTDTWGNAVEGDYAAIATTVAGLKQPSAALLTNYAYRIGSLATYQVSLPNATDVQEGDYLLIDDVTLQVHVLLEPHSIPGLTTCLAALLK